MNIDRQLFSAQMLGICLAILCAQATGAAVADNPSTSTASARDLEFFEKNIRPLFSEHCYKCHSAQAEKLKAELRLDSRDALLRGGESGPAIVPGQPDQSRLLRALRHESLEMPPKYKLPDPEIEKVAQWIAMNAPWPDEAPPVAGNLNEEPAFDLEQRRKDHWVWQPIQNPAPPETQNHSWPRQILDRFILAKLEKNQLAPAADADRTALLRRLYFDLTGLPPTPRQARAYLEDASPLATEKLVDRLLASPHFGERWGRHWLDLVRYAESRGHEHDHDARNAHQYRDYIIRALNANVPYDQIVREHIAGDLIPTPRLNPDDGFNESILGTGFWFLGEWSHSPVDIRKDEADRFDNMIDVMSKTFLGVTVSCARCHDHKFDAISAADYYALSGFLQSSDYRQVRFESLEHNRRVAADLLELDHNHQQSVKEALQSAKIATPDLPPLRDELAAKILFDYSSPSPEPILQNGFIFGHAPLPAGSPWLSTDGGSPSISFRTVGAACNDLIWNGLESISEKGVFHDNRLSQLPRSGRTLRTPTFELNHGQIACRVQGSGTVVACVDSHRLIAGPLHGETVQTIQDGQDWVELNLQRYVGHRLHLEFTPAEDRSLEIIAVMQGASAEDRNQWMAREKEIAATIANMEANARTTLGSRLHEIALAWARDRSRIHTRIMRRSHLAIAMMDGTGEDEHLLIRGNHASPGAKVPRRFLTAVSGEQPLSIPSGSGRLALADEIVHTDNPLTPRVAVNRLWHHLLGRGIVPTADDFGVLGQRPTHPELLDHLAHRFVEMNWDLKAMIRYIVLSRTYSLASEPRPEALASDPKNELWHYRPPKRLEGEAIRDALLWITGDYNDSLFGEPVPIHLTPFMEGRGRPKQSGPMDGDRRRSIYIAVRRNFLSPFMLAFDTPAPFSTMGRRNVSNVPAQALILMNDPFVIEQAGLWARRAQKMEGPTEVKIEWMFQTAFARLPSAAEKAAALAFLQSDNRGESRDSAWNDLAHALINTKEFIFLR